MRKTGWEGYDFIVNRAVEGKESWLEQNAGAWNWKKSPPCNGRWREMS